MSKNYVIIVAAGSGTRMEGNIPKQFMLLDNKPILMHTMEKFTLTSVNPEIVLVLSDKMQEFWKELCREYQFKTPHTVTKGGNTRFQSVKNGLSYLIKHHSMTQGCKIAVHDAARPLVSHELIDELYEVCDFNRNAVVPASKCTNSIRLGSKDENIAYNRELVWQIQTPQVFLAKTLIDAYNQEELHSFTDDASVVEKMSNNIYLHPSDPWNIKITYKEDIAIAHLLINKN